MGGCSSCGWDITEHHSLRGGAWQKNENLWHLISCPLLSGHPPPLTGCHPRLSLSPSAHRLKNGTWTPGDQCLFSSHPSQIGPPSSLTA